MRQVWRAVQRLSPGRRAALWLLAALVAATWLAVCAILVSYAFPP